MIDFQCDPSSCAGPVDNRAVEALAKYYYRLDPNFLESMAMCHGGEPSLNSVTINNQIYKLARFLTTYDSKSEIPEPFRPHFDYTDDDERLIDSISYLVDGEHNTARALFSYLLPFATKRTDEILYRGYTDLFCFDYRAGSPLPEVVIWDADKAMTEVFRVEKLPPDEVFNAAGRYENINWDSFLIPVAVNFVEFSKMLYKG